MRTAVTPPGWHSKSRPDSRKAQTATAVALALAAIGIGACGGGTKTVIQQAPQTQTVVQPPAETVTQTVSQPAKSSSSRSASSRSSDAAVPDLVGERLDVAEDDLDGIGLRYREVGGGTFGIVVKSNWIVCDTSPRAGEQADGPVRLVVDREC